MSNLAIEIVKSEKELADAKKVRGIVFQEEQGIDSELDFDGKDETSDHIVVYENDTPIGTARIRYLDDKKELAKIERVAVIKEYRKSGIGKIIMDKVHEFLEEKGIQEAKLESQEHAKGFYEKLGYQQKGEAFKEVGIPHVEMRKKLKMK
jgi:predicted GNAT family N-acyltransferase